MSEEAMLEKIKELEEENKKLKRIIERGNRGNSNAYNTIRMEIMAKVDKEVIVPNGLENWQLKELRQRAERQIMRDLKWDLHVRQISDFRVEHIEPAIDYIQKYELAEDLKKSRWA